MRKSFFSILRTLVGPYSKPLLRSQTSLSSILIKRKLIIKLIFEYLIMIPKLFLPLEQKSYVQYLGLLIDSNLSWKNHIGHITSKISKTVGIIARLRYYVPTSVLLTIYQSLIFPYLSYGIVAWGHAAQTYINQILVLQKRGLRVIYFTSYRSHSIPLFVSSNTISINMLSRLGAKMWNNIPQELRKLPKLAFKANLQNRLLDVLMEEDDYVGIPFLIKKIKKNYSK